jgi:hypothetical protein
MNNPRAGREDLPEFIVSPPPHFQVLRLGTIPECGSIGLVPEVNHQASCHVVASNVRKDIGQEIIPTGPVAIVARVRGRRVLRAVGSPQVVDQKYEIRVILSGGLVV